MEDEILVVIARLAKIAVSATDLARRALDDVGVAQHVALAIPALQLSLETLKASLRSEVLKHSNRLGACIFMYTLIFSRHSDSVHIHRQTFDL